MAHRLPEIVAKRAPLHVLPRGTATVQDYAALMDVRASVNRKIGWRWDGTLGPTFVDPASGQTLRHGGRVKLVDEVATIAADDPHFGEYVKHLQQGDLWAADPQTAAVAGVPFEPHFLGEHPKTSALHGCNPLDDHNVRALVAARTAMTEQERLQGLPWDTKFKPQPPGAGDPPLPPPPVPQKAVDRAPSSLASASK